MNYMLARDINQCPYFVADHGEEFVTDVKTVSNILEVYKDLSYTGHESLDALLRIV